MGIGDVIQIHMYEFYKYIFKSVTIMMLRRNYERLGGN